MATNVITPTPAAPPAPPAAPAVTPVLSPGKVERANANDTRVNSMLGDILSKPDTDTSDQTITPDIEATPGAVAEPEIEPTTEPVAQPAEADQEPAPAQTAEEPSPFEEPEPVTYEAKPDGVAEKTWKTVFPAYQFVQELKKPFDAGGIGHEPTVDDVRQYYDAFADRVSMEEDFVSGNGQAAVNFVTKWFGPGADGAARQNADFVAGAIPHALAAANPAALSKLTAELTNVLGQVDKDTLGTLAVAMPQVLLKANPEALGAMSHPIISSYTNELWNRWGIETNPQIKEALYNAAQVLTKDTTGDFRMFDKSGKPVEAPAAPQVDRTAIDNERATLDRERAAFQQQKDDQEKARANQWKSQMNAAVHTEIEPLYELALKPLKNGQPEGPYNAAKRDFMKEITSRVQKDPKWPIYVNLWNRAFRSGNSDDMAAVQDYYKDMATRAITGFRANFLTQWGVAAKKQSDGRNSVLAAIDAKREPSTAGAPTQPTVNGGSMARKRGESNEDFLKRQIRAATQ